MRNRVQGCNLRKLSHCKYLDCVLVEWWRIELFATSSSWNFPCSPSKYPVRCVGNPIGRMVGVRDHVQTASMQPANQTPRLDLQDPQHQDHGNCACRSTVGQSAEWRAHSFIGLIQQSLNHTCHMHTTRLSLRSCRLECSFLLGPTLEPGTLSPRKCVAASCVDRLCSRHPYRTGSVPFLNLISSVFVLVLACHVSEWRGGDTSPRSIFTIAFSSHPHFFWLPRCLSILPALVIFLVYDGIPTCCSRSCLWAIRPCEVVKCAGGIIFQ